MNADYVSFVYPNGRKIFIRNSLSNGCHLDIHILIRDLCLSGCDLLRITYFIEVHGCRSGESTRLPPM